MVAADGTRTGEEGCFSRLKEKRVGESLGERSADSKAEVEGEIVAEY